MLEWLRLDDESLQGGNGEHDQGCLAYAHTNDSRTAQSRLWSAASSFAALDRLPRPARIQKGEVESAATRDGGLNSNGTFPRLERSNLFKAA